jgi:thioesterase domain-containing protein
MLLPENKNELELVLRTEIPLLEAADARVRICTEDTVELWAPLEPNRNDKNIVFAGSIASVAAVCGWVWVQRNAQTLDEHVRVVMAGMDIRYTAPINGGFVARCIAATGATIPEEESALTFRERLEQDRKARVTLVISVISVGGPHVDDAPKPVCATVTGRYAAHLSNYRAGGAGREGYRTGVIRN